MKNGRLVALLALVACGCSEGSGVEPDLGARCVGEQCGCGGGAGSGGSGGCCGTMNLSTAVPDGPPPIAGGTLLALSDGKTLIASDPDFDQLYVADLSTKSSRALALEAHDEPGRLVEDAAGRVHVALRRGGAVVTIDPATATVLARQAACPAPRGIAYEPGADLVHVACAGGELVSLPASGGAAVRTIRLDPDLRDVVVIDGSLFVSKLRTAELLSLDATGQVVERRAPGAFLPPGATAAFTPSVAWRTIVTPSGQVAMLHQRGTTAVIDVSTGAPPPTDGGIDGGAALSGYGDGNAVDLCAVNGPIVHSTISLFDSTGAAPVVYAPLGFMTLAIDVAVTAQGRWAFVAPSTIGFRTIQIFDDPSQLDPALPCLKSGDDAAAVGQPIAVAAVGEVLVVQTRNPAALTLLPPGAGGSGVPPDAITLNTLSSKNPGHDLFHTDSSVGIACASCHPEGGDDGRVWQLDLGPRRTMPLQGGVRGTEPFHWRGEDADFEALLADVLFHRMHGSADCQDSQSLANWVESLPLIPPSPTDPGAVLRGQQLFQSPAVGCASCHNGPHLTNNATLDVGTGGAFQVPRLHGLAVRPPYLHDGCARTLADRFGACGGGDAHGHTSQLTDAQRADLVSYLGSL